MLNTKEEERIGSSVILGPFSISEQNSLPLDLAMTVFSFLFAKPKPEPEQSAPVPVKYFLHVRITVTQSHDSREKVREEFTRILKGASQEWLASETMNDLQKQAFISQSLILHPEEPFELLFIQDGLCSVCLQKDDFKICLVSEEYKFNDALERYSILENDLNALLSDASPQVSARLNLPIIGKDKDRLNGAQEFYEVQISSYPGESSSSDRVVDISSKVDDPLEQAVQKVHAAVDELLMLETTA
uniref:PX domain-containing protein n=1 Tax=Steinernema glaseri TaxID=37863 RepID=A0A1I7Y995_9BILA